MPLRLDALTQMRLADDAGAHDVEADLVVGCDGRGSSVRTRTGLGLELSPSSTTCCGGSSRRLPS